MRKFESCNKNQVKPFQPDLMAFPMGWGGRRSGAGNLPKGKTVVVRVSVDLLEHVKQLKALHVAGRSVFVVAGSEL